MEEQQLIEQTIVKSKKGSTCILDVTGEEAKEFFLKSSSYCNFDLPIYFDFTKLLKLTSKHLNNKSINSCLKSENYIDEQGDSKTKTLKPLNYEKVNYKLINNKDGKYAWRPFQLINPLLYVDLVHQITKTDNWVFVVNRFNQYKEESVVDCLSIPVISNSDESDKATSIYNWWHNLEQKSIELALDYEYLFQTDITDCYGSIYTHSIAWALNTKELSKKKRKRNQLLGNYIDGSISDMSYGQTNGIPQGSTLMDFVAEMVLGYADILLTEKIKKDNLNDFKILRYRDDYRIFSNSPQTAELIAKHLTEVLSDLGLKLNNQKTNISNEVVIDSIKKDKTYWVANKRTPKSFQKKLYAIYLLSQKHPNSGTIVVELNNFLESILKINDFKEDVNVITSILIDLTIKNPRIYPVSTAILSKLLSFLNCDIDKQELIKRIEFKYSRIPNTGLLELWLQRICIKADFKIDFKEPLCSLLTNNPIEIWNVVWLNEETREIIKNTSIIDEIKLKDLPIIIEKSEVELFKIQES